MSAAEQTIASLRRGGSKIITVGAVMAGVAAVAVVLRYVAKVRTRTPWGMDDLLITLSLAIFATVEGLTVRAVVVGRNATVGTDADFSTFLLLSYIFSLLYWSVIASATASLLFLYRRIFFASPKFRRASAIVIVLVAGWWISGTLADALAWQPTRSYWDSSITGNWTIQYNNFWLASMIAEMVLETATLVLPIRQVAQLNLSWGRKLLVGGLFLMGGLVLVSGIVRIYYAWAQEDMTPGVIWLAVHSAVAIISACLPTYRALFPAKLSESDDDARSGAGLSRGGSRPGQRISAYSPPRNAWPVAPPGHAAGFQPMQHRKSADSTFSDEPLTALPPMTLQRPKKSSHSSSHSPGRGDSSEQPRRALFAEVDRGLKQLNGRPESRFDWRRSKY